MKPDRNRPLSPAFDWFEKDMTRLGNDLRSGSFTGTFSNRPQMPLDMEAIAAASRRIQEIAFASSPSPIEFDGVSVTAFWMSIQKIEFLPTESPMEGFLVITAMVPDRATGRPIGITFRYGVSVEMWKHKANRAAVIREVLRYWMQHEIDEHIYIDEERAFEPHVPQTSPRPFFDSASEDALRYFGSRSGR